MEDELANAMQALERDEPGAATKIVRLARAAGYDYDTMPAELLETLVRLAREAEAMLNHVAGRTEFDMLIERIRTLREHTDPAFRALGQAAGELPVFETVAGVRRELLTSVPVEVGEDDTATKVYTNWQAGLDDRQSAQRIGIAVSTVRYHRNKNGWINTTRRRKRTS